MAKHHRRCLHRLHETVGGGNQTLGWTLLEQVMIFSLTLATGVTCSVRVLCLTMLVVLISDFAKCPFIWDSEFWCIQTDVAFALACIETCGVVGFVANGAPSLEMRSQIYASATRAIKAQMTIFYAAAAFWKLNSAFLDPHASCAPIFVAQLIDLVWPSWPMPRIATRWLVSSAPLLTIALEGGIAIGLGGLSERLGVLLALALHLGIALCPPPNNVATFSLMCASRLVAFVPSGAQRALRPSNWSLLGTGITAAAVAISCRLASHPGFFDLALPLFVSALPIMCLAVALDENVQRQKPPFYRSYNVMIGVAFVYSFLLIPLGLQDQGQPHMYANLRLHAGSNHFVAPTGLLQRLYERNPARDFSGGVVRIETTDSSAFNDINPSEYTKEISQRARDWLRHGGHSGRMWNPMLSAVTSSEAPSDTSGGPFTKYTVPAHEFRRLMAIARRQNQTFTIVYTQLFGTGDETWRAQAAGRTVRITEWPQHSRKRCKVLKPTRSSCSVDDLPNLPPLGFFARKFLLFESYPIILGDYVLHCFGP